MLEPNFKTTMILGVPFHRVRMDETLNWVARQIELRSPSYLVTANLDFATQASEDSELQRLLLEADLVICDGTPLVWASRALGTPLPERVTGADLVPRLCAEAAKRGWRIYFLGSSPEILDKARSRLCAKHPGLQIVGMDSPPVSPLVQFDHETITRRISDAKPDLLLVAFGCPKQEKWIGMHYQKLGVPLSIGVGASIDFVAGKAHRAPGWIGKIGAEWIVRLIQEPRRLFKRYFQDLCFLATSFLRQWKSVCSPKKPGFSSRTISSILQRNSKKFLLVQYFEHFGCRSSTFSTPSADGVILDFSQVLSIDSAGLGALSQVFRAYSIQGSPVLISGASPQVIRALKVSGLSHFITLTSSTEEALEKLQKRVEEPLLHSKSEVILPDELRARNALRVESILETFLQNHPTNSILKLDMREVSFIDTAGISTLLRVRRQARSRNLRVELINPLAPVRNSIRLAKADHDLFSP